ncbi:MAG: ATP-dependent helicase RhlE [Chloroflexota bacterium]
MSFDQFKFHPRVAAGVRAAGYQTPTPIQAQAIPPVMTGRDVMGLAQTGTGKTAAFALPILQRLLDGTRGRVRALVVAPTRELAEQIHESFVALGKETGLRSVTLYGGVGMQPQVQKLRAGVDIVVACPGRLLDHIGQGTVDLSQLEVLVLDEADHMFDMGFLPDVRRILRSVPAKRQTLLFSATMPQDIRALAQEALRDPVTVQIGHIAPAETVSHALYPVPQHLKTPLLLDWLKHTETQSVLIFTGTKYRAKRLGEKLEQLGYKATSLQGNLSQNRRQAALDGFRDGEYKIMVATDIAARGIDVSRVSHVINYDMPTTAEAYTHRIGRTGRASRSGSALSLVTTEDDAMVRAIERLIGTRIERRKLEGFDYSVSAPARDQEFARPPREPQQRRRQPEPQGQRPQAQAQPRAHARPAEPRYNTPTAEPRHTSPSEPRHTLGNAAPRRDERGSRESGQGRGRGR